MEKRLETQTAIPCPCFWPSVLNKTFASSSLLFRSRGSSLAAVEHKVKERLGNQRACREQINRTEGWTKKGRYGRLPNRQGEGVNIFLWSDMDNDGNKWPIWLYLAFYGHMSTGPRASDVAKWGIPNRTTKMKLISAKYMGLVSMVLFLPKNVFGHFPFNILLFFHLDIKNLIPHFARKIFFLLQ